MTGSDMVNLPPMKGKQERSSTASLGIARAAGINSLGNVASRLLGLVRESVIAGTFGASGATSSFDAVSTVPKMVYELLIGGMLSAALIPVLSEYAVEERRAELEEILSLLLSLAGTLAIVIVVLLELAAPLIAPLLVGGFDAQLLRTATKLIRLIVPSIPIYVLSGILQAYHYARRRFVYPAMGAPAHNLGVIIAVLLFSRVLGIASLSIAIVLAALTQFLVQLPGLKGVRFSWTFHWRHPVVRRILQLYAPVVLSIVVQNIGIIIDRNLASRTMSEAITWMNKATFLIQLPLGLVSIAISLAVLPTLSQIDARKELSRFKSTLSLGLRLVLVVIIPATAGLFALGKPIIELIFEHGEFTPMDTLQSWNALRLYLLGLPFAAIDLPLVFAFYAQKDTLTPVIVGIVCVLLYLIVGPTLAFLAGWSFLGLVMANSVQLTSHALLMLALFGRRFGGLQGYGVLRTALKAGVASIGVGGLAYGSYVLLRPWVPAGFWGRVLLVGVGAGLGTLAYLFGARFLRIGEVTLLWAAVQRRLGRGQAI
ncbi:MAG: murein biosynthesis integral membrane protein MurJ [Anaerolineae bacterium]|nr:murein biosynthesis integral membrane protein MurJ [Anaerolineae bacterium]